jgi:hypothetical protein
MFSWLLQGWWAPDESDQSKRLEAELGALRDALDFLRPLPPHGIVLMVRRSRARMWSGLVSNAAAHFLKKPEAKRRITARLCNLGSADAARV